MARSTYNRHYRSFLTLLRDLREQAGVTQVELGERLANTQTFVSKIERGERRLDVVELTEICEALGADPSTAFKRFLDSRGNERAGRKVASFGELGLAHTLLARGRQPSSQLSIGPKIGQQVSSSA